MSILNDVVVVLRTKFSIANLKWVLKDRKVNRQILTRNSSLNRLLWSLWFISQYSFSLLTGIGLRFLNPPGSEASVITQNKTAVSSREDNATSKSMIAGDQAEADVAHQFTLASLGGPVFD